MGAEKQPPRCTWGEQSEVPVKPQQGSILLLCSPSAIMRCYLSTGWEASPGPEACSSPRQVRASCASLADVRSLIRPLRSSLRTFSSLNGGAGRSALLSCQHAMRLKKRGVGLVSHCVCRLGEGVREAIQIKSGGLFALRQMNVLATPLLREGTSIPQRSVRRLHYRWSYEVFNRYLIHSELIIVVAESCSVWTVA